MAAEQVIVLWALGSVLTLTCTITGTLAASAIFPPTTTPTASTPSRTGRVTMRPQRRSTSI